MNGYELSELLIFALMVVVLVSGKKIPEVTERLSQGTGNFQKRLPVDEQAERNAESKT